MEDFFGLMAAVFEFFKLEFNIYGFEFSLWHVFLFTVVVGLLIKLITGVMYGTRDD